MYREIGSARFCIVPPLMALILNKLEIPVPKDAFSPVHLKLPCGSEDEDFKIPSLYFRYFNIITPWKRA